MENILDNSLILYYKLSLEDLQGGRREFFANFLQIVCKILYFMECDGLPSLSLPVPMRTTKTAIRASNVLNTKNYQCGKCIFSSDVTGTKSIGYSLRFSCKSDQRERVLAGARQRGLGAAPRRRRQAIALQTSPNYCLFIAGGGVTSIRRLMMSSVVIPSA